MAAKVGSTVLQSSDPLSLFTDESLIVSVRALAHLFLILVAASSAHCPAQGDWPLLKVKYIVASS